MAPSSSKHYLQQSQSRTTSVPTALTKRSRGSPLWKGLEHAIVKSLNENDYNKLLGGGGGGANPFRQVPAAILEFLRNIIFAIYLFFYLLNEVLVRTGILSPEEADPPQNQIQEGSPFGSPQQSQRSPLGQYGHQQILPGKGDIQQQRVPGGKKRIHFEKPTTTPAKNRIKQHFLRSKSLDDDAPSSSLESPGYPGLGGVPIDIYDSPQQIPLEDVVPQGLPGQGGEVDIFGSPQKHWHTSGIPVVPGIPLVPYDLFDDYDRLSTSERYAQLSPRAQVSDFFRDRGGDHLMTIIPDLSGFNLDAERVMEQNRIANDSPRSQFIGLIPIGEDVDDLDPQADFNNAFNDGDDMDQ